MTRDVATLLLCDIYGLYGSDLYMLWNDCCDRDYDLMKLTLLRCHKANVIPETLRKLVRGDGRGVPVAEWTFGEPPARRNDYYKSTTAATDDAYTFTHIAAPADTVSEEVK